MTEKILLTIVTESGIEKQVVEEIVSLGPDSYATAEVRGRGPRRGDRWDPKEYRAVRIEVVCDASVAHAIADKLSDRYFRGYSMMVTLSPITVLRSHPS
jgi:hypothetical protein